MFSHNLKIYLTTTNTIVDDDEYIITKVNRVLLLFFLCKTRMQDTFRSKESL